jgi:hypothetical protein
MRAPIPRKAGACFRPSNNFKHLIVKTERSWEIVCCGSGCCLQQVGSFQDASLQARLNLQTKNKYTNTSKIKILMRVKYQ